MPETPPVSALIYDWNTAGDGYPHRLKPIELDDETLRDGLQSPSVRDPDIDTKIRLLHLMDELGIHSVDVGLPGAGPRAFADITRLCREIVEGRLRIKPNCAVRTVKADITPLIEISHRWASRSRPARSSAPLPYASTPRNGRSTTSSS